MTRSPLALVQTFATDRRASKRPRDEMIRASTPLRPRSAPRRPVRTVTSLILGAFAIAGLQLGALTPAVAATGAVSSAFEAGSNSGTGLAIGRYRTPTALGPPSIIDLGIPVTVPAGTTALINSYLVVGGAGELTAVSNVVYCRPPGSSTIVERTATGQNVPRGTTVTLLARALVTAPGDGALDCRSYALVINHTSTVLSGTISILTGTRLQVTPAIPSSAQTWQASWILVNSSYSTAPVRFTAAAGVKWLQSFGDVNITTCYPASRTGTCNGAGYRRSKTFANVGTQFTVRQLNADGTVCRTFVNHPLTSQVLTQVIHHLKVNQSIVNIPVTTSCTSRTFVAAVRVTTNLNANSVIVEANHQSGTALYVRPVA